MKFVIPTTPTTWKAFKFGVGSYFVEGKPIKTWIIVWESGSGAFLIIIVPSNTQMPIKYELRDAGLVRGTALIKYETFDRVVVEDVNGEQIKLLCATAFPTWEWKWRD